MARPDSQLVLPFAEARRQVEDYAARVLAPYICPPLATVGCTEQLALLAAVDRVLAEEIAADRDFPPFPRATRDGYAVRAADLAPAPASLQVMGEVRAGVMPDALTLNPGEALQIMTGAPLPAGADAVVMIEYTARAQQVVTVAQGVAPGENVVATAAEAHRGDILLRPGARLTPAAIALAASVGRTQLRVFRRPRVAILATGDEIVEVGATPGPAQIRNSNTYSLAAQVTAAGGEPLLLPIAPDERRQLRRLIADGSRADLLLITGGVSMGKYDLVEPVLDELGAQFFFTGALIQPGRPIVFGDLPCPAEPDPRSPARGARRPFFGLPGNPVSTMVCFELFARVVLEALTGIAPGTLILLQARLKSAVRIKPGLTRFLPAQLSGAPEGAAVEPVRWQGSGDIAATARANCYLVVPPDREQLAAGEMVAVLRP